MFTRYTVLNVMSCFCQISLLWLLEKRSSLLSSRAHLCQGNTDRELQKGAKPVYQNIEENLLCVVIWEVASLQQFGYTKVH